MVYTKELIQWGEENCYPGHEFGGKRDYFLIHIINSGNGEFFTSGKRWALTKGDAFLIFPGQMHIYKADNTTPWSYFWLGFTGELNLLFDSLSINKNNPVIKCDNLGKLYNLYQSIIKENTLQTPVSKLENLGILNQILGIISRGKLLKQNYLKTTSTGAFHHVNSMEDFILMNFNTPIKVQDVLGFVNLERSYASRIFKDKFDISIGQYIIEKRLELAKKYLKDGWSTKETAFSCGFSDYHNFLKSFKNKFNITAGKFKYI